MAASVPFTFSKFRNYLKKRKSVQPFDGEEQESTFRLGRISSFMLIAGLNLMFLSLFFFVFDY